MKKKKWYYNGDVNIEHGGVYYTLDNLEFGYFDAVSVQPCSDAGAQDNAWWITEGCVHIPTDNDKVLEALRSILSGSKRESESLHWLLTDPNYVHTLFWACFSYAGIEKDHDEVVQIGPKEACRDYVEPTIQLKAGASLERFVIKWRITMTQERTLFTFPIVAKDEPLVNDPFYAWLDNNVERPNVGRDIDRIKEYLTTLGFEVGKHFIGEEPYQILTYVLDTWCRLTPYFKPHSMRDLFSDKNHPKYHVRGIKEWNEPRSGITPELHRMVEESGWIYEVHPENCYFEINGDALHACYQQILGSRFICRIKEGS